MRMENEFYRFEFKYELEPSVAKSIEERLKRFGMKLDKHVLDEKQNYSVTSLYFDSSDLSDYYDKMGGFLERKKLRARIYEPHLKDSNTVWLEIKNKYDMKIHKKRFSLTREEWDQFLKRGASSLPNNEIKWHFLSSAVKPSALVRYTRKPYILDGLRITFDSKIEACKKNDLDYTKTTTHVKNKGVVMEVKFSYLLPHWFKNIIREYNLRREAFSKYSNSIDAIHQHNPLPK